MKTQLVAISLFLSACSISREDAASIISKTEAKYLDMKFYLDSGKAISHMYNLDRPITITHVFKTAYSDDGSFNFETNQVGSTGLSIINKDVKGEVRAWDPRTNSVIAKPSFEVGLAGAGGSGAHPQLMIIDLLAPGSSKAAAKNTLHMIPNLKLEASETINGTLCFKLSGTYSAGKADSSPGISHTIWISQKDFLIRKIETDYPVQQFRTKNTLIFYPYTPKMISKDLFEFKPGGNARLR